MPIPSRTGQIKSVTMSQTATVAEAIEALIRTGGDESWSLLIRDKGTGTTFGLIRQQLLPKYGPALFGARLADLPLPSMRGDSPTSPMLTQLYGEYVKLSQDERATWRPQGKAPPQYRCGCRAWPEFANSRWVCSQCKQPI